MIKQMLCKRHLEKQHSKNKSHKIAKQTDTDSVEGGDPEYKIHNAQNHTL